MLLFEKNNLKSFITLRFSLGGIQEIFNLCTIPEVHAPERFIYLHLFSCS